MAALRFPIAVAVVAILLAPCGAAAGQPPESSGKLWIEEGYTDNLRADATGKIDAFFTMVEGELDWHRAKHGWLPHHLGLLVGGRAYSGFPKRDYVEVGPSFEYDWDPFSVRLSYVGTPERLRTDSSDGTDGFADTHELDAELRAKFGNEKRWTAAIDLDSEWEFYDPPQRQRSFFEETVEAGLRYRATGRIFPRASVIYASRDSISSNFDREDAGFLVGFDALLPLGMRSMLRFEKTWRNYLVGFQRDGNGSKNTNFGREDDIIHVEAGLDLPVPRFQAATVQLRYRWKDDHSTRKGKSYDSNEATLRLAYDFD